MGNKVYIACSMIKAQQLDFSLLDYLIKYVQVQGFHSYVPGKMDDAPSKVIFDRDLNWLKQSSIIIADVNEPSHGVGMEIMYAYVYRIPVICLLDEKNMPLSRMVEGGPHTLLLIYRTKEELIEEVEKIDLNKLEIKNCSTCTEKTIHLEDICKKC
ncbi:MAG: nucleoside 2-deoxyribosyltransferase [Candidatus Heimdallarchaeota archaeon]|nr:nucleoside 2-deoxyribosyltransferase [Candidatus Heimdallarchaeota archaeon]